jgi:GrpB-like predicted nucleotidyltransferase (UPF0157 family)
MNSIGIRVRDYLAAHPYAKTRFIAVDLGLTAKQVDNVLYQYRQALRPATRLDNQKAKK